LKRQCNRAEDGVMVVMLAGESGVVDRGVSHVTVASADLSSA